MSDLKNIQNVKNVSHDNISRQAVIDLFAERLNGWTLEEAIPIVDKFVNEREQCDDVWHAVVTIRDIAECVKQDVEKYLPSAEPERKTGRWILFDSDSERYDDIKCSACGKHFTVDANRYCDIGFIVGDLNYCPNCGAKMEVEHETD